MQQRGQHFGIPAARGHDVQGGHAFFQAQKTEHCDRLPGLITGLVFLRAIRAVQRRCQARFVNCMG